jgi:dynein heavy chain
MFLMTDAQVPNELFLVLINDMLASGEIPELFTDDETDNIIGGVRNEVNLLMYNRCCNLTHSLTEVF